jgi:transposase
MAAMQVNSLRLRTQAVGALPVIQRFLDTLQLRAILAHSRPLQAYIPALELLVKSLLVEPNALYRIRQWSQPYDPRWIEPGTIGDDAIGRALDRLFEADRASLLTHLALSALKHFDLGTSRVHNDSTSVKVSGAYAHQFPHAVQLRRGFSKDHRPDLKQLVYSLCVTSDGAVPIHFKAYDGNQSDDTTHWEIWQALCRLLGKNDFIYVADSKLCVRETLRRIDGQQGRFVTILPRTRSEIGAFADDCLANRIRWAPLWRQRCPRHQGRREIFELAQGFFQMQEGFGLHWYRSSEKRRHDHEDREEQIAAALERLERLNNPKRRGRKDAPALQKAADQVLAKYHARDWIQVQIQLQETVRFRQNHRGHPTPRTLFRRAVQPIPKVQAQRNLAGIARAQAMDGIFPLTTNTQLTPLQVLRAYKYQPHLEKRHSLFKSLLEVSPLFLKKNTRIEAFIFVHFVAQLVASLIERTVRQNMARQGRKDLPILPEGRPSQHPSASQILETFAHRFQHQLYEDSALIKTFIDPLRPIEKLVLAMLDLPQDLYIGPARSTSSPSK